MKRSLLATVVLVVGATILAVGLVGARLMQTGPQEAAHAAETFVFAIDADATDGTAPCHPINTTHTVNVGDHHEVAVCTVNEPNKPTGGGPDDVNSFSFTLTYDPLLNSCTPKNCSKKSPCTEDDNPDANAGSTLGSGVPTTPNLGDGWDCSGFGLIEPTCTAGTATMTCLSAAGPYTSGGLSPFPLAVVKFTVVGGGETDTIVTSNNVWKGNLTIEQHPPSVSADVEKLGATAVPIITPTSTMTPTATSTPWCGGPGQPACPTSTPTPKAWTKTPTPAPTGTPAPSEPGEPGEPAQPPPPPPPPTGGQLPAVVPPATGTGSGSVDWTTSLMWTLAGAGAFSVFLGGLYLRRARNR